MQSCVVLDIGSYQIKAGFAGESGPRTLVPTITAQSRMKSSHTGRSVKENAKTLQDPPTYKCPIAHGIVEDVDQFTTMLQYIYLKELRADPTEHPVLFTEHSQLPLNHRDKLAEVAFEQFSIPAVYFSTQSVLSLYTSGLTSGLTVDVGHDTTSVVPVCETYQMQNAIRQCQIGGLDVTQYLHRLLVSNNPTVSEHLTLEVVRYFKENLCHIAQGINPELIAQTDAKPVRYRAPDGQVVAIGSERFFGPELLFRPDHGGMHSLGLHQCISSSIQDSPPNLAPLLYSNIVLSGGSTLFPGFVERLRHELVRTAPAGQTIRIYAPPERQYSVWIGGSILASLNTFSKIWVTKQEYEEIGPAIVRRKCA